MTTDDGSEDTLVDDPLTEQQALNELGKLFARAERLQERAHAHAPANPQGGSSLVGDDRAAQGWSVSSAALSGLITATEHLQSVRYLLADAHVLPVASPYTLLRTALECAAGTVWLLAPPLRADRVHRRLIQARQDYIDRDNMTKLIGNVPAETPEQRLAKLNAVTAAASGDPTRLVGTLKIERTIEQAAATIAAPVSVHTAWKVCSGMAHGRLWATFSLLPRDQGQHDARAGVTRFRVTNAVDRVLWAAMGATDAVQFGLQL